MSASATRGRARVDRERYPLRMKDLCEQTGLDRQAIHFYIQQGLVPEGAKTGRNMAYYGPEHVARIQLVRRLQRERFLPLRAIKAMLDGQGEGFTDEQQRFLGEVKRRLGPTLGAAEDGPRATTPLAPLLAAHAVPLDEARGLARLGLLTLLERADGLHIPADDTWAIQAWAELRAAGLTAELGFTVDDLAVHVEAMSRIFEHETQLALPRLSGLSSERGAVIIERALPALNDFLARLHNTLARDFLSALE